MEIFWRLVLGHLIADFTLQTNFIAAWKRRSMSGLLVHCAIHPVMYALLLWKYLDQPWIDMGSVSITGYSCIAIVFVAHFVEDLWRIWSVQKKGAPDNTFFYLWDQVIHYAVLFAVSPVVDGHAGKFGFINYPAISGVVNAAAAEGMGWWERFSTITRPEDWVWIAILITIVTHFTTVTIYFIEKDFFGRDFPEDREKYIGIAERLLVMGCFLLPGWWWMALVAVWIVRAALYKLKGLNHLTWTNILAGNSTAVLCGVAARLLLYR